MPRFIDYLFLAFWTATAVSPTDTVAVKPWAKLLMMLEAAGSIALAALVIARAINILKYPAGHRRPPRRAAAPAGQFGCLSRPGALWA